MSEVRGHEVYIIRNNVNEKVYVGITKNGVKKRFGRHKRDAAKGGSNKIHRAISKHGADNFWVEVYRDALTEREACDLEVKLIDELDACGDGGYNISVGGGSGIHRSEETRLKKSLAGKAAWEKSDAMKESVINPERRRKIGEHTVMCFSDPEYRAKFDARHALMVELSKSKECRDRARQTYKDNGHTVAVRCLDTGDVFESLCEAATWASERTGLKCEKGMNIGACLRGKRKTAYGMKWEKHDPNA